MKVDKNTSIIKNDIKMKLLLKLIVFLVLPLVLILTDIMAYREALNISRLAIEENTSQKPLLTAGKAPVFIGVISRFSPHNIYKGYQPVMDYLTEHTDYHFQLKLSKNYDETVMLLANGEVEAAFLGSFIFVSTREEHDLRCILKPLNRNGLPFLHAALVTTDTSSIFSITDLKGKQLALPSSKSFSANWLPMDEFPRHNISPSDLSEIRHFPFHHMVIRQILRGNYDAGVVKDRVAKEFTDKGIRILALSGPIPGSPIVAGPDSDPAVIEAFTQTLLSISPEDSVLKQWDPEFSFGFVKAENKDYDVLEKLIRQGGKK